MGFLEFLILIAIGILCGVTTGVIGASGVLITVSTLNLILGYSMRTALGTSLGVDLITTSITTWIYYQHDNVDLQRGVWMLLAAMVGIFVGSHLVLRTPEAGLQGIFVLFLFTSGIFLIKGGVTKINNLRDEILDRFGIPPIHQMSVKLQVSISIVAGFIIGILCGFQGAGGGFLFLIALVVIFGYNIHKAVGTSTLMMMATAASGVIPYTLQGAVNWCAVVIIGIASLLTNRIAAKKANQIPEKKLTKIGGSVFIFLGCLMLIMVFDILSFFA